MTQHPKGAELVAAYDRAIHRARIADTRATGYTADDYDCFDEATAARNAIIALIDDPVRAAGPELLAAAKRALNCIDNTEIGFSAALEDSAGLLRAAIAKAQAPADAEGGDDAR